jgi:two-component system nitrogen regulation response regulator GlnG
MDEGRPFDLIILDHNMPGMTGAQALDQIKKRNPRQPVLIITGFRDGELDRALAQWPGTAILIKPLTRDEVVNRLNAFSFMLSQGA